MDSMANRTKDCVVHSDSHQLSLGFEYGPWVDEMARQLRERAGLPDLGERLDGKTVDGRSAGQASRKRSPTLTGRRAR